MNIPNDFFRRLNNQSLVGWLAFLVVTLLNVPLSLLQQQRVLVDHHQTDFLNQHRLHCSLIPALSVFLCIWIREHTKRVLSSSQQPVSGGLAGVSGSYVVEHPVVSSSTATSVWLIIIKQTISLSIDCAAC